MKKKRNYDYKIVKKFNPDYFILFTIWFSEYTCIQNNRNQITGC